MKIQNEDKFIKGVESLINPMEVSDLLFLQRLKGLLPRFIFKRLLLRASKKTPYIGFVIEPYSLFLFFRLRDVEYAKSMLPDRYELARTRLFTDDEPDYYMGIGNLGTRASTFWGTRQECYLVATDKETGLLSFIFIDIFSNTLIAMPSKGLADPNCRKGVFTTSSKGDVYIDIQENRTNRRFCLNGSIKDGRLRKLDQKLWVMGNTSIGHSRKMAVGGDHPFAVIFDPSEVDEALDIPPENLQILENTLFPGLSEPEISTAVCFPFAQHYMADSPGCYTSVKDVDDLIGKYNQFSGSGRLKTFSSKTIVRQLTMGIALAIAITIALVLIL